MRTLILLTLTSCTLEQQYTHGYQDSGYDAGVDAQDEVTYTEPVEPDSGYVDPNGPTGWAGNPGGSSPFGVCVEGNCPRTYVQ